MKRILFISYICIIFCFLIACKKDESFVQKESLTSDEYDVDSEAFLGEQAVEEDTSFDENDFVTTGYYPDNEIYAVHVCGAVVNPGVYYLDADSLKQDALNAAGGFVDDACKEYINLAEHIKNGEQIYFPYADDVESLDILNNNEIDTDSHKLSDGDESVLISENRKAYNYEGRLNINFASKEELMNLPGIGGAKAEAIISYRNDNGGFKTIEDIKNISGIKEGVYNKIKDYITVD